MKSDYEAFRLSVLSERVATGASWNALARKFGVTKGVVAGLVRRAEKNGQMAEVAERLRSAPVPAPVPALAHPKPKPPPPPPPPAPNEPMDRVALRMKAAGFSLREIGKQIGSTGKAVHKRLKRLARRGITTVQQYDAVPPKAERPPASPAEIRDQVAQRWAAGQPRKSIAADLGLSEHSVDKHLRGARQAGDLRAAYRRSPPTRKAKDSPCDAVEAPPRPPAASAPECHPEPAETLPEPPTAVQAIAPACSEPPPPVRAPPRFVASPSGPLRKFVPALSEDEEQRLIEQHIRTKGVTVCPPKLEDRVPEDFGLSGPAFGRRFRTGSA